MEVRRSRQNLFATSSSTPQCRRSGTPSGVTHTRHCGQRREIEHWHQKNVAACSLALCTLYSAHSSSIASDQIDDHCLPVLTARTWPVSAGKMLLNSLASPTCCLCAVELASAQETEETMKRRMTWTAHMRVLVEKVNSENAFWTDSQRLWLGTRVGNTSHVLHSASRGIASTTMWRSQIAQRRPCWLLETKSSGMLIEAFATKSRGCSQPLLHLRGRMRKVGSSIFVHELEILTFIVDLGAETALWEELLQYNVPRLEHYALNFQQSVATFTLSGFLDSIPPYYITQSLRVTDEVENFCDSDDIGPYSKSTHRVYMKFAQAHIQELRAILCSGDRAAQLRLLAEKAYSIRHMMSVQMFINSCGIYDSRARKLLSDINFLGRLRSCYLTLIEAAETIASFCNVSIVPVDHPPLYIHRPTLPPLEAVFRWADLTLNQNTVQNFMDANATVINVEQSFKERGREASSKPLSVHAEIQLVFHIAKTIGSLVTMKEIYPYIGCSKLCCFLCYVFILSFGQGGSLFRIRGCHGKVYPSWSLPNADRLQENMATELYSALRKTLDILVREMKKPVTLIPLHVAESSANVSDDYSARSSYMHAYHRDLAAQREFDALRTKLLGTSLGCVSASGFGISLT